MNSERWKEYIGGMFCSAVGLAMLVECSSLICFFADMSKRKNDALLMWFGVVNAPAIPLLWLFPSLRIHCFNGIRPFSLGAFVSVVAGFINWFLVFYALLFVFSKWKNRNRVSG